MDIIISDKWLREYLKTNATAKQIAEHVSLCGPSVERIEEVGGDTLYHIEITTNRIDTVSVYGFAREAAAILPRFNIPAKLVPLSLSKKIKYKGNVPFKIIGNNKLVKRAMGVVLTNIENWKTPSWMAERLNSCGMRSLNAVVDITNYVMLEVGHPSHAFDYDKIKNKKFVIRESKKGEKVTSFDDKTYSLIGGDIVFDDGDGEIIDLPGIIGTKNSVVNENTKNVFFFIDNDDPVKIRQTSMGLAIRTMAASINEKGVDPELGEIAILRGLELFQNICKAQVISKIFDLYPKPYREKTIQTDKVFIDSRLGINLDKKDIQIYLSSLGFKPKWDNDALLVLVPSYRADDINIPEDLIEEIARIYGYFNLPSRLLVGNLPDPLYQTPFPLESRIKTALKSLGGYEIYTLSLVSKKSVDKKALHIKNPMGSETEYLRTELSPSIADSIRSNGGNYERIFLFEISNTYKPIGSDLPQENMTLGMGFDGYKYFEIKGILQTLFDNELHMGFETVRQQVSNIVLILSGSTQIGVIKFSDDGMIFVEIGIDKLMLHFKELNSFTPVSKFPPQIEDITFTFPDKTKIGEVIGEFKNISNLIQNVELKDIFKESYTFRLWYQSYDKTLDNGEVNKIRASVTKTISSKFGARQK